MKVERPKTPEELFAESVRELSASLSDKTRRQIVEALARAMRDGRELAKSEFDLGNILILAVLGYGTKVGEADAPTKEIRLVLDSKLVEQVEGNAWVMTREVTVSGDVVLIASPRAVRGTMDVPAEQAITKAPVQDGKVLPFERKPS